MARRLGILPQTETTLDQYYYADGDPTATPIVSNTPTASGSPTYSAGVTYDLWGNPVASAPSSTPDTSNKTNTDPRYANWGNFVAQQQVKDAASDANPASLGIYDKLRNWWYGVQGDLSAAHAADPKTQYYIIAGGLAVFLVILQMSAPEQYEYDPETEEVHHRHAKRRR